MIASSLLFTLFISVVALLTTSLQAFQWPTLSFPAPTATKSTVGKRNGLSPEYPYRFEGRFIFRPSLVRTSSNVQPPNAKLISLLDYSLGGSVVLEYDVSPVGPYREYVTMGGAVGLGRVEMEEGSQRGTLGVGQWGTNLYVSTQVAEDVCRQVWGVPAQVADIGFVEDGETLVDGPDEDSNGRKRFSLSGWGNTRILESSEVKRFGNIPIYWTPTIKALWAPILSSSQKEVRDSAQSDERLPLHKLRLSASALRLQRCKRIQQTQSNEEIPLGIALVVDNVLIEIGKRF
jgi:hypothetical protein